jgi:hypothetical protein
MSVSEDKIRVFFAGSRAARLLWLRKLIEAQHDMSVVRDEDLAPLELLLAVREARPDVVILGLTETGAEPGICSNLLAEYPRLLVLALSQQRDQAFLYQQSILKQTLKETSDNSILNAIRTGEVS